MIWDCSFHNILYIKLRFEIYKGGALEKIVKASQLEINELRHSVEQLKIMHIGVDPQGDGSTINQQCGPNEPGEHEVNFLVKQKFPITKSFNVQIGFGANIRDITISWKGKFSSPKDLHSGADNVSLIRDKRSIGLFPGADLRLWWSANYVLPEISGNVFRSLIAAECGPNEPGGHEVNFLVKQQFPITKSFNVQIGFGANIRDITISWKGKFSSPKDLHSGADNVSLIRDKRSIGLFPGTDLRLWWSANYVLPEISGNISDQNASPKRKLLKKDKSCDKSNLHLLDDYEDEITFGKTSFSTKRKVTIIEDDCDSDGDITNKRNDVSSE
ncbi:hypothetical protein ACFE04_030964 [Oxalis oulophora]